VKGLGLYTTAIKMEVPSISTGAAGVIQGLVQQIATFAAPAKRAGDKRRSSSGWTKKKEAATAEAKKSTDGEAKEGESERKEEDEEKLNYEFGDNALNFEF